MSRVVAVLVTTAVLSVLAVGSPTTAQAHPRMSLTSGAPCSTCHINKAGGEMRTEIGWGSMLYAALFDFEDLGIDFLADMYSNEVIEERLAIGWDIRVQMARLGRPLADDGEAVAPPRRVFPMQLQPHAALEITEWLKIHGSYAVNPGTFEGTCDPVFAGQSCYVAQAIIDPSPTLPSFRVGDFQPTFGLRHDDHTMLIRHDASLGRAMIPVGYGELGAEVSYQPRYWVKAEAGGFWARRLADSLAAPDVVNRNDVAYAGRLTFMPRFDVGPVGMFGLIGGSTYGAGSFRMDNGFLGLGVLDHGSVIFELAHFTHGSEADHRGLNLAMLLSYDVREWLVAMGRLERGVADVGGVRSQTEAASVGLAFFPIPFVKILPEYRLVRTDDYAMGQYTAQLHLFF